MNGGKDFREIETRLICQGSPRFAQLVPVKPLRNMLLLNIGYTGDQWGYNSGNSG